MKILAFFLFLAIAALAIAKPLAHSHHHRRAPPPQSPAHQRRGIAFNDPTFLPYFQGDGSLITWKYNWDSKTDESKAWFRFVPMLHSLRDDHAGPWKANAEKQAHSNYYDHNKAQTWLLAFNEPDNCEPNAGGSCITVSDAVDGWRQHMEPLADFTPIMYLGSPAVTNAASPPTTGLGWLKSFLDQCSGCTIDFVNIHWYGSATDIDGFKNHIDEARKVAGGRPIWITEFRGSGTDEDVIRFLDAVMPWMDGSSDIHRYAYFMARPGEGMLINENGDGLSAIGKEFDFFDH